MMARYYDPPPANWVELGHSVDASEEATDLFSGAELVRALQAAREGAPESQRDRLVVRLVLNDATNTLEIGYFREAAQS